MRITRRQLRRIIREERSRILKENMHSRDLASAVKANEREIMAATQRDLQAMEDEYGGGGRVKVGRPKRRDTTSFYGRGGDTSGFVIPTTIDGDTPYNYDIDFGDQIGHEFDWTKTVGPNQLVVHDSYDPERGIVAVIDLD